ncbi:MAG TPA: methyltransferase [Pilimelia sp.]|nr:methyltransferase [Pilimelia sp.]
MPLNLDPAEAAPYLEANTAPAPHLDFLTAVAFRTAGAALRLGVFEALADGPLPAGSVADRTGTDVRGVQLLLEALVSFGYVVRTAGGYANSPVAARWLRRDDPDGYATILSFWHTLVTDLWTDLEQSVRDGVPARDFYTWLDRHPDTLREFQSILDRMAGRQADEVVPLVPVPATGGRLLDLGGGHCRYSIAFCLRHPGLHATVVDSAAPLAIGAAAVAAAGLGDRVTAVAGDFLTADLGQGYDVALLFNVVHGGTPAQVAGLLRRVAAALRPGGVAVLLEPLSDHAADAGAAAEAFVRTFSLHLFHTQGGQVYAAPELSRWLAEAGFGEVRRHRLTGSEIDHLLIAATSAPARPDPAASVSRPVRRRR